MAASVAAGDALFDEAAAVGCSGLAGSTTKGVILTTDVSTRGVL